jgi:hypothetical protein|tara:strand:+ start:1897 stop:2145 length:249 start_codon:yes stop_codon:yes gene_type:complete
MSNKKKPSVDSRLEELTVLSAKRGSDIYYIKESVDNITVLLKEQNGRIRKGEQAISMIKGIGSVLGVVFGSFIAWLFNIKLK